MNPQRTELAPGYSISRVVNGGWQLSAGHALQTALNMSDATAAFNRLADLGFDTFDGADIYTGVEDFYGSIIRSRRAQGLPLPLIHTKFVPDAEALASLDATYVERIITRSRERLSLETLHLVQFHWWDYQVPGCLNTALELKRLQSEGFIAHIGATNFNSAELRKLLDGGVPIVSNQVQYSLLDRRPEKRMIGLCREYGVQLICYGSLAGGFLSEKWLNAPRPVRAENRSLVKYLLVIEDSLRWEGFQKLLRLLKDIGEARHLSISNVASRYVMQKPHVAAVIIGTRSSRHIESNLALFQQELLPEDIAHIDAFLADYPTVDADCFDLERLDGSKHRDIMRMNLADV